MAAWLSDNNVVHVNEVTLRQARLVLRWVTMSEFNSWCGTFISVCDQPPMSTQPGHPFLCRHNEYQPKAGDALRLGRYGSCVGGSKTTCSRCYTQAISEHFRDKRLIIKRYINSSVYLTYFYFACDVQFIRSC